MNQRRGTKKSALYSFLLNLLLKFRRRQDGARPLPWQSQSTGNQRCSVGPTAKSGADSGQHLGTPHPLQLLFGKTYFPNPSEL